MPLSATTTGKAPRFATFQSFLQQKGIKIDCPELISALKQPISINIFIIDCNFS
jgi:hypothetical protein